MLSLSSTFPEYLRRKNLGQLLAHLELLSTIVYWGAVDAYKGFGKIDYKDLANKVDYPSLVRVCDVKVSMAWMGKKATFSAQKYSSIRKSLEGLGLFTIERQANRQGTQQAITQVQGINYRAVVELLQAVSLRMSELVENPWEDPMMPSHGFSFLHRWHKKVFGFMLGDVESGEEQAKDPDRFWIWAFKHEKVAAFRAMIEAELLREYGWGDGFYAFVDHTLANLDAFDRMRWDEWMRSDEEKAAHIAESIKWLAAKVAEERSTSEPVEPRGSVADLWEGIFGTAARSGHGYDAL